MNTDSLTCNHTEMAGHTPLFEMDDNMISMLLSKTFKSFCPGDSAEINFDSYWDNSGNKPAYVGVQVFYENKFLESIKLHWSMDNQTGHITGYGKIRVPDKSSTEEIAIVASYMFDYNGNTNESFDYFREYFISLRITFRYFKLTSV